MFFQEPSAFIFPWKKPPMNQTPWKWLSTLLGFKRKRKSVSIDSERLRRCHALIVLLRFARLAVVNLHFLAKLQEMWPKSIGLANNRKLDSCKRFGDQNRACFRQIEQNIKDKVKFGASIITTFTVWMLQTQ